MRCEAAELPTLARRDKVARLQVMRALLLLFVIICGHKFSRADIPDKIPG